MSPLISIVVPTFNQAQFIEQTLASIVGQGWNRLELIVIDGGSTDGTQEIVKRYPVTHFVSEKDEGQADAINKGFRLARGEILAWLNSDDYYLPLTLARVAAALAKKAAEPALVYGECLHWYEAEKSAKVAPALPFHAEALQTSSFFSQPSAFWTRALWEKAGELRPDLHYVLDWEWWLRATRHCIPLALPDCLSVYRFHPAHKTGGNSAARTAEILALVERHASREWVQAFHDVGASLDTLAQTWAKGSYRWHRLRHLPLYLKHGVHRVESAFFQLYV